MEKPCTGGETTSRPMQYSVAPWGTTRALGWMTLRLATSSRYRKPSPVRPAHAQLISVPSSRFRCLANHLQHGFHQAHTSQGK